MMLVNLIDLLLGLQNEASDLSALIGDIYRDDCMNKVCLYCSLVTQFKSIKVF